MGRLHIILTASLGALAALAANIGTSSLTTIDTTDHAAAAASPRIEARAGATAASPAGKIDTSKPLSFMLIMR